MFISNDRWNGTGFKLQNLLRGAAIVLIMSFLSCGSPEKSAEEQMQEDVAYFADLNCKIKARSLELPFLEGLDETNDPEYLTLVKEQEQLTIEYREKYGKSPEQKKAFSFMMREAYKNSSYCGEVMKKYGLKEADFRKTGRAGEDKEK